MRVLRIRPSHVAGFTEFSMRGDELLPGLAIRVVRLAAHELLAGATGVQYIGRVLLSLERAVSRPNVKGNVHASQ